MLITIFIPDETMLFLCVALLAFISFSIRSFGYGFFTLGCDAALHGLAGSCQSGRLEGESVSNFGYAGRRNSRA